MQMHDIGVQHLLYSALESGIATKIIVKVERTTGWKVSFIYNKQVICSFEDTKIIRARLRCYLYLVEFLDIHNIASRLGYTNLYQQYCIGLVQAVNGAFLVIDYPTVNDRYITVATTEDGLKTVVGLVENMGFTYKKLNKSDFSLSKKC